MTELEKPKLKNRKDKYSTGTFYHYANQYRMHLTEEQEIEKIDMTEIFYKELDTMIQAGELININVNAPPTSGKSITAFAIADTIKRKHFGGKLNIKDIDRDQQEFSRTMRNEKIKNTIRPIDEWNELEETGENSSIESALYNYFSDVMAQRFIHKISCSPKDQPDKNALIFLEVISTDKQKKLNHCRLYYRLFSGGNEIIQLLGMVTIDVSEILKQKWYKEYRKRKFEKMNLILKEGIFRPRVLEYAEMILTVINRLYTLTQMTGTINTNIVRNYIKMECRERKIPQSIIGEELATREAMGVLDLYKEFFRMNKKVIELKINKAKKKITPERYRTLKTELENARDTLQKAWLNQIEELEKYRKIYKKYNILREG